MLKSYKYFISESKNFQKNAKKQEEKIKNFLKYQPILDWIYDVFVIPPVEGDENRDSGLKYTVWLAQQMKKYITNAYVNYLQEKSRNFGGDKMVKYVKLMLNKFDTVYEFVFKYLENPDSEVFKDGVGHYMQDIKTEIKKYVLNIIEYNRIYDPHTDTNIDLSPIADWFLSPLREEKVNLKELTLETAYEKAKEWHDSLTGTGTIKDESGEKVLEFDDGYYWIDLGRNQCKDEGEAMGHCATTGKGTLFSLRKNKRPHVTTSFNKEDGTIYQMKGKQNTKPKEKYHPYIVDFLIKMKVENFGDEYNPHEDFSIEDLNDELFNKLNKENPKLIYDTIGSKPKLAYKFYKENKLKNIDISKYFSWEFLINCIYSYEITDKKFITFLSNEFNKINFDYQNDATDNLGYNLSHINNFSNIVLWYFNFIPDKYLLLYSIKLENNGKVILKIDKKPLEYYKEENGVYFVDLRDFLNKNIYSFLVKGRDIFYDEWDYYFDIYEDDNTEQNMEEYFCKN